MMTGLDSDIVLSAMEVLNARSCKDCRSLQLVNDYSPDNVSEKILRILMSYTGFVNREVWRK